MNNPWKDWLAKKEQEKDIIKSAESIATKVRTPMTEREQYAAQTLAQCTFLPGSYNKRFAHSLADAAKHSEHPMLTDRQRKNLWRLVYMHRRQIRDKALIAEAKVKRNEYF